MTNKWEASLPKRKPFYFNSETLENAKTIAIRWTKRGTYGSWHEYKTIEESSYSMIAA